MTHSNLILNRQHYYCPTCASSFYPVDKILEIEHQNVSQDFSLLIGHLTALARSHQATKKILAYTGKNTISVTKIRRIAHALGQLLVEHEDELLKQEISDTYFQAKMEENRIATVSIDGGRCRLWQNNDGEKLENSQWKEAKLGCIALYRIHKNENNDLENNLEKKEYIGRVDEASANFGKRLYGEALRRGYESAHHKVFLADGAKCNWEVQQTHFGTATPILDWYHATEHLTAVGKEIYAEGSGDFTVWLAHAKEVLFEGDFFYLDELLYAGKEKAKTKIKKKIIADEREYFFRNRERIRYKEFRKKGFPISSCLIESGMKITVNERIKGSEKHWRKRLANFILTLKIAEVNNGQQKLCQLVKNAA